MSKANLKVKEKHWDITVNVFNAAFQGPQYSGFSQRELMEY